MNRRLRLRLLAAAVGLTWLSSVESAMAWRNEIDEPLLLDRTQAHAVAVDPAGDVVAVGVLQPTGWANDEFGVVKLAGGTGALLWRQSFVGTTSFGADDVAVDAAGDIFAVGALAESGFGEQFTVIKLASANGMELWREQLGTFATVDEGATAVAIDGAGNVVASGEIDGATAVVKLAGATGTELWRQPAPGWVVTVDAASDVIAAGDSAVAKLSGATGAEQWQTDVGSMFLHDVAVDGAGNVIAVGIIQTLPGEHQLLVVKLGGATGAELWRRQLSGTHSDQFRTRARSVAVDASSDVVVAGGIVNRGTAEDWIVMKLAGATGADIWVREVAGSLFAQLFDDRPEAVALDAAGDVLVAGDMFNIGTGNDFAVAKFDGATGAESWRQSIHGTSPETYVAFTDGATDLAVTASGDVIAAGFVGSDFSVYRLSGLDGVVGPVSGSRLTVVDRADDPNARRLIVGSGDRMIKTPPSGSAGDPTVNGGSLTLRNPVTLESATLPLPAGSWQTIGTPPDSRGYKYTDATGVNGACKRVLLKAGKLNKPGKLNATCLGRLGTLPFSLDEPTQGALEVSVQLGAAEPQCVRFGGSVRRDAGTGNPGPRGLFVATNAPSFSGDCQ